jgi:hypothetical protein
MLHSRLVGVLASILRDMGVPDIAVVKEARGLRTADASGPRDVVVLGLFAEGRRLAVDALVNIVYRNIILKSASNIPSYAAKQAEDRKF